MKEKDGSSGNRKERWREHSEVLNREEPENPATEENIVEHEIAGIKTEPATLAEIKTLQEA